MTRWRGTASALLALALLFGSVLPAWGAQELRIDEVRVKKHPQVTMTVTAPTRLAGQDLSSADFTIREQGLVQPHKAKRIAADELEVVVLIDTSGSMAGGNAMAAARSAAAAFVDQMPAGASLAVVNFGTEATVASPLGAPKASHISAIGRLEPRGETALYDAIAKAAAQFPRKSNARRSIILLSDGGDTVSKATQIQAERRLVASDARLYAIELKTKESDPRALLNLAKAGGGKLLSVKDAAALSGVYDELASELTSQYILSYTSQSFGPTEVSVSVGRGESRSIASVTAKFPVAAAPPPAPAPETAPEAEITPPRVQVFDVGWLGSRWALLAGAAAFYLALALIVLLLLAPRARRTRLAETIGAGGGRAVAAQRTPFAGMADRASDAATRFLERRSLTASLNAKLEQAGIALRPGEYVVLVVCAAIAAIAVGLLLDGLLIGIVFGVTTVFAARLFVSFRGDRRRSKFADQLSDTLQQLSGSLRAGYSLLQAIDGVAQESEAPTSQEFGRLVVETRLGRNMDEALEAMAERLGSEDFQWVAQAISIQRRVGGDLARVLDTVAATIRQRNAIRRQVQALSAEGRLSAIILTALPILVAGFMWMTNRAYLMELTTSLLGWAMLGTAAGLMLVGIVWLRKVVKIEF